MDGRQIRHWMEKKAAQTWDARWSFPIVLGFLLSILDPFGFSSATDQRSHSVFNRIAAPFYSPQGYNWISIVLIDDDYLKLVDDTYPMSRYNFLDIHSALTVADPAAIFYDFHLPDTRGEEDATRLLGSEIAASAANPSNAADVQTVSGNPFVWFADFGGTQLERARYDLFGQVETLPVRTLNVPVGEYAPCQNERGEAAACTSADARKSPALTIYGELCARLGKEGCSAVGMSGTMVLQWSRKPEPGRSDCSEDPDSFLEDALLAARIAWSGLFEQGKLNERIAQNCYPFQTIRAADLVGMSEAALKAAFDGQIIFVGGFFSDAPDTSISPVHGQLPGVFVHATALENFITFGDRYWRADRRADGAPLGTKHLVELLALLGASLIYRQATISERAQVALASQLGPDDPREMSIARRRAGACTGFLLAQISTLIIVALIIPLLLSMPPTNFYGLCALTVPLMATAWLFSLSNWLLVSTEKGAVGYLIGLATPLRILIILLLIGLSVIAFFWVGALNSTQEGFQFGRFMFH